MPHTVRSRMATGASWMVLFKLLDRAMGLVSVVVLARLLVPADFGLVALAMSIIAVLEVLGAFGFETALIQRRDVRRDHYDAVWTFNVAFGAASAAVIAALAWPASWFYDDPRVVGILLVLAAARLLQGFENTGVVAFRKEMQFDREFRYLLAKRLAPTLLVTLPLAFMLRTYWALVAGSFAAAAIGVALSYAMHPMRPRFSLRALSELVGFSKWLYVASIVDVVNSRLVDVLVGRLAGTGAVGTLAVGRELARLPRELNAPVQRAVFPGYVQLAGDGEQLRTGYLRVTSVLMLVVVPAAVGLSLLAEPAVALLLGPQWSAAVPVVQVLALNAALGVLVSGAHHVNLALGMARSTTLIVIVDGAVTLPLAALLVQPFGVAGVAWAVFAGSIVAAPLNLRLLDRAIGFGRGELRDTLARPLAAAIVMVAAVLSIRIAWPMPTAWASIAVYAATLSVIGAAVYVTTAFLLAQRVRGRWTAETYVLERVRAWLAAAGARLHPRFARPDVER